MRKLFGFLPLFALAACGGAGPQSVGSLPGTVSPTGGTGSGNGNGSGSGSTGAAPGSGGNGAGVTAGTGTGGSTATGTSFLTTNPAKTYNTIGSASSLQKQSSGTLYQGDASTVKTPLGTVDYDPRDGIFTLKIADTKSGVSTDLRYQDPLHHVDFTGARMPQSGVPNLAGFNYLESVGSTATDLSTFFYQRPGSSTIYVTLAGYVRNNVPSDPNAVTLMERGAFVFGDQTPLSQVPASGTATYTGGFLASMVYNPTRDTSTTLPTYYQWLSGNSSVTVDFGKQSFALALSGSVDSAGVSNVTYPTGTSFFANGSGSIDLLRTGGLSGSFQNACFVAACGSANAVPVSFASVTPGSSVSGASSIDAAFYGPDAVNVGGSFRIIGGVPDQRVDINGAFTGAKVGN